MRARLYSRIFGNLRRQRGLLLGVGAFGSGGGGTTVYVFPTPPTPALGSRATYSPNFAAGPSGKDRTRPVCDVYIDGVPMFANGWDAPWTWNQIAGTFEDLTSDAPGETGGEHVANVIVLSTAAGTFLANGDSATYYMTLRNSRLGRETAPQSISITNSSGGAVAVKADLTTTALSAEWDQWRLYRRFQNASGFKLIATTAIGTATYTDDLSWTGLESAAAYVPRYRALKLYAKGVARFAGRLFAWTGEDSTVWVGQTADLVDGDFVEDDFYTSFDVGADGTGGVVTCVWERAGILYVGREHEIWRVDGDDPASYVLSRVVDAFGCVSRRTTLGVRGFDVFLDKSGLLLWSAGGEPYVAGSPTGYGVATDAFSPLAPVWPRLNLGAADLFTMDYQEATGEVELHVALDGWPVPNYRIVYSTNERCYTAFEPFVGATAQGYLLDAQGARHFMRGCQLAVLWEQYAGNSQGVYAGDLIGTIATTVPTGWGTSSTFSTDPLLGMLGCPVRRYTGDAAADVIETNVAAASSGGADVPHLYWSGATAAAAGQLVRIGVIPMVWQLPGSRFATPRDKLVSRAFIEFEKSAGATAVFESRTDSDAFRVIDSAVDLSSAQPWELTMFDRCATWTCRVSQDSPGMDLAFTALDVQYEEIGTRGQST